MSSTARRATRVAGGLAAAAVVVAAVYDAGSSDAGAGARNSLTLIAPAAPGGGYDLAARESQLAMRESGISNNVQVVNVPGAGGAIGLSQLATMDGDGSTMMVMGLVMLGALELTSSDTTLDDVQPIARLADDYIVLVVPADSPFQTLDDFLQAWAEDPSGTAVGGGSLGGTDHLVVGQAALESDIDAATINYIPYPGGGEALTALLSGTVAAGFSGYNDFSDQIEAGNLRALALASAEPVDGIDVPTFVEQGLEVALPNWRGIVAPGGLTDDQRTELEAMVTETVETESWQDTLERNRWQDSFMVGAEFEEFLVEEQARVADLVAELGL